jgi:hypothetical protein
VPEAGAVAEMLEARGVTVLYSPAYTPRYNGSIEAGIGVCALVFSEQKAYYRLVSPDTDPLCFPITSIVGLFP